MEGKKPKTFSSSSLLSRINVLVRTMPYTEEKAQFSLAIYKNCKRNKPKEIKSLGL